MEPEKMDTAPLVKQEVDENSTLCNQVGAEIPSEVNEETAPSPTTGDEPPVNPWCVIKCVFCLQMLSSNDNPKLMECLHTACSSCVAAKLNEQLDGEVIENNVVVCPVCRVHCHANNLIENQFLLEVSGSSSEANATDPSSDLKCTSCHENSPATSWCVECSEYICDGCVQAHQRLKITKEHTIKPKEEANHESPASASSSVPKSLYCSVHRQESLSLFCETCDQLTCRDCQLSDHREHKYKFIHEIASETKGMIGGLLQEVSYKRVLLTSAMKVIDDRQNMILDKKKSLVKEITQVVVRLTNAINLRGKQLVLQLNEVCDAKHKTLKEKKVALEQLSSLTDHCIEFVNNALNKGSDMALLYSKKTVTQHLQRIKSRRADIPNPEIPVRIGLMLDKVPDLIKVVSAIGGVVVDGRPYSSLSAAAAAAATTTAQPTQASAIAPPPPYPTQQHLSRPSGPTPPAPPLVHLAQPPSAQRVSPHNRMSPHNSVSPHNNISPHQSAPTLPVQVSRHMPMSRQHSAAMQAVNIIQPQPGGNHYLHHQQVTSSTHPQTLGVDANSANLRGLLSHQMQAASYNPVQPVIRVSVSGSNQHLVNGANYRAPPVTHPTYASQLPPPAIPRYSGQQLYHIQQQQQQQQQQQHLQQMHHHHLQQQQHQLQQQHRISPHGSVMYATPAGVRPVVQPRTQSPHSSNQQVQWHIPQHAGGMVNGGMMVQQRPVPQSLPMDESFKITLKTQVAPQSQRAVFPAPADPGRVPGGQVTSSVPKTPSPSHARVDDTEKSLDKFCQESVNDLMATIAKLDRNGIEVVPEGQKTLGSGDSPHVDSSTGLDEGGGSSGSVTLRTPTLDDGDKNGVETDPQKDDPNEDWCAVCMDGGEVVVCCDKCPKVFHQMCHIPKLAAIPDENETWQCLLCTNLKEIIDAPPTSPAESRGQGLCSKDQKVAERLLLELYCQYEPSLHFREIVGPEQVKEYYSVIKKPMALDVVRRKLDPVDPEHYSTIREFIADIRLIFRNAYIFNPKESQVFQDAKSLEEFFDSLLEKWLPAYAYDVEAGSDDDSLDNQPHRKYRRILSE